MAVPLEPPSPAMAAYQRAHKAALYGNPERAARMAELEREAGQAETDEEFRAAGSKIADLLREVSDEIAPAWPRVWYSGKPGPK